MGVHVPILLFLPLLPLYQSSAALLFFLPVFLFHQQFYPVGGEGNPFAPHKPLLKLPKFRKCTRLNVIEGHHIATFKEHLNPLVDPIHNVVPKNQFPAKALSYCCSKRSI